MARFWPSRLVDESTVDPNARDPNGIYLFGLSPSIIPTVTEGVANNGTRTREDIEASLSSCLRSFENGLRNNQQYYDEVDTFISLDIVKLPKLPARIIPDPFVWPDNGIDQPEEDDDADSDQEPQQTIIGDQDEANTLDPWEESQPLSSAQRKRAIAAAKSKKTAHIPAAKLRTSTDVYNRLLWDATGEVSKDGYMIGYEDRFKGVKEVPLTAWKREVEDESFVSQFTLKETMYNQLRRHRFHSTESSISNEYLTGFTYGIAGPRSILYSEVEWEQAERSATC